MRLYTNNGGNSNGVKTIGYVEVEMKKIGIAESLRPVAEKGEIRRRKIGGNLVKTGGYSAIGHTIPIVVTKPMTRWG